MTVVVVPFSSVSRHVIGVEGCRRRRDGGETAPRRLWGAADMDGEIAAYG